jgi:hypothetical protein
MDVPGKKGGIIISICPYLGLISLQKARRRCSRGQDIYTCFVSKLGNFSFLTEAAFKITVVTFFRFGQIIPMAARGVNWRFAGIWLPLSKSES